MDLEEYLNEITDTRWAALDYLDSINEQQIDKRSYEATIKEVQTA